MKTKNFFFALVLFFSLVFKGEAQTITETAYFVYPGSENSLSLSVSADKEYIIAAMTAGSQFNNGDVYVKISQRDNTEHYPLVNEYSLPKDQGAELADTGTSGAVISNNGNAFVLYTSNITSGTPHNKLMKLKDGNTTLIHEFVGSVPALMKVIDGYLYLVVGDNTTLCELWKIDESTNAIIYQTSYPAGIGHSVTSISKKVNGGDLRIQFWDGNNSEFILFDEPTGNVLNTEHIGLSDGDFITEIGGNTIYYSGDQNISYKKDINDFSVNLDYTNWDGYNHYIGAQKMYQKNNGEIIGFGGTGIFRLTAEMTHKYSQPMGVSNLIRYWMNPDLVSLVEITKNGDNYSIIYKTIEEYDETYIPQIDENYYTDVDVYYGKRIDESGNFVDGSPHEAVIGFPTGMLPQVGDPAPKNTGSVYGLFSDPTGNAHLAWVSDFAEGNGVPVVRAVSFNNTLGANQKTNILVYCVLKTSLGVQDENLADTEISVYPNPTNEILNLTSSQKIENITIYNTRGQKTIEKEYEYLNNDNEYQINISKLTKGTYFARIKGKFGVKIRKFVVK